MRKKRLRKILTHRNLTFTCPGETQKTNKRNLQRQTALWSELTSLRLVHVLDGSDLLLPSLSSSSCSCQTPAVCGPWPSLLSCSERQRCLGGHSHLGGGSTFHTQGQPHPRSSASPHAQQAPQLVSQCIISPGGNRVFFIIFVCVFLVGWCHICWGGG